MPSVLIIDDESNIRRMVGALLTAEGYEVRDAHDGAGGLSRALEAEPDALLLDLMIPGELDGMATLARVRESLPDVPVIMMSGRAGLSDAVKATKLGAFNFLEKPLSPESVLLALSSAMELRQARREARTLRADLGLSGEMIGDSPGIRQVRGLIERVAPSDSRVMITGESGTGKELVAAAIHAGSARRDRPFVRVNCAAIPRDLVESEMFGHERGAFTGATDRRIGRFELAHRGTLFLDEVGDLGAEAQAKLLRAIEAKEIERVGGGKPIRVDVRIVSATNKDLIRGAVDGVFREDLLFRLNVIPIPLPPLRDRPGDIPALVRHFAALHRLRTGQAVTEWSDEAVASLSRHRWPGNVRELANIVERLAILHAGRRVTESDVATVLPIERASRSSTPASSPVSLSLPDPAELESSLSDTLDDYERTLISRALSMAGGNVAEAARRLRTDRPNLYRRMRRLGIAVGGE
jgi:two-component system, NtrC family, nitrogen regulation response regulator NtrX